MIKKVKCDHKYLIITKSTLDTQVVTFQSVQKSNNRMIEEPDTKSKKWSTMSTNYLGSRFSFLYQSYIFTFNNRMIEESDTKSKIEHNELKFFSKPFF